MNGKRERLAWMLLIGSSVLCAAISLIVPLSINAFIQQSTRSLDVNVQANQGTVGILHADNETGALFAGELGQSIGEGASVLTNDSDTELLII